MVDAWSWSSDSYVPVWELRHGEQLLFLKRGSHMVASGVPGYGAVDWAVSEYAPGVDLPEKGTSAEPVVGEDLTRLMDAGAVLAAARRAAGEASLGIQGLPLSDADEMALGIAPTGLVVVPVTDEMLGVAAGWVRDPRELRRWDAAMLLRQKRTAGTVAGLRELVARGPGAITVDYSTEYFTVKRWWVRRCGRRRGGLIRGNFAGGCRWWG
jgi:hypothetical protein